MSLYEKIAARAERNEILFYLGKATQLSLLKVKGALSFGRGRIISDYLKNHSVRKLQLGSGLKLIDGWLNSDCSLFFKSKCFIDVTAPFPLADKTFDYVFTEHVIEHLTYEEGQAMLKESYRVLKPGGGIRVSCPDLRVYIALFTPEKTPAQQQFIKMSVDNLPSDIHIYKESFVINNSLRNWGHKFVYDEETLTLALESAGFVGVKRWTPGESDDPNLQGLEDRGPKHEGKCFESQILQARRPN